MTVEKAYAKITLFLRIEGKRPDGYHDLTSVMQTVSLHDTVAIRRRDDKEVTLSCGVPALSGSDNLCVRAALAFLRRFGTGGCDIALTKRIPWGAGLGGGSADCAAVLRGMNRLYGTGAETKDLETLGAALGADVPFLVSGGTALARGIGEILTPLPRLKGAHILIIEGKDKISTPEAYGRIDAIKTEERCIPDHAPIIRAVESGNVREIGSLLFNDFESVYGRDERYDLCKSAAGVCLTGSGSAVFALFSDLSDLKKALERARKAGYMAHACHMI